MAEERFISIDIETDGPIPGDNSMLALGAVAWKNVDGRWGECASFYQTLEPLDGAEQDPDTMTWWGDKPEAWAAATKDPQPPGLVTFRFIKWLESQGEKPFLVAWPVAFDIMWVRWYCYHFQAFNLHPYVSIDMRSVAMGILGCRADEVVRKAPAEWAMTGHDSGEEHNHIAEDDAREQAIFFANMLEWGRARRGF